MADTFLQAFQVGANLYDRAQSRKMEQAQFQQQAAQFVLQREQAALQQQLGALNVAQKGFELKSAQEEATAQTEDAVPFNDFQNRVLNWSIDPSLDENAIGTVPQFKSKAARTGAASLLQNAVISRQNKVASLANTVAARSATAAITQATRDLTTLASNFQGMEQFVYENGDVANPDGTPNWGKINSVKAKLAELMPAMKVARDLPQGVPRAQATAVAAAGGEVTPDMLKRGEGQGLTDAAKKAKMQVDVLKARGIEVDPRFESEIANKATTSGGLSLDAVTKKEFAANDTTVSQLDSATQKIAEFNKKYGAGAFDDYVGPLDNPAFELKGRAVGIPKQAEQEARDIFKKVNVAIQGYRKANFGTALSANELETFNKIIPPPSYASYSTDFGQFANALRDTMKTAVSRSLYSPDIVPFLDKYGPKGAQAAPAVQAAPAPVRLRFDATGNLIQ